MMHCKGDKGSRRGEQPYGDNVVPRGVVRQVQQPLIDAPERVLVRDAGSAELRKNVAAASYDEWHKQAPEAHQRRPDHHASLTPLTLKAETDQDRDQSPHCSQLHRRSCASSAPLTIRAARVGRPRCRTRRPTAASCRATVSASERMVIMACQLALSGGCQE